MKLFRMFGIGEKKILSKGCSVNGTVTAVQISRIYVVKKPVRIMITEENTMFSHWITFTYCVNGVTYKGKRYSLGCYSKIEDAVRAWAYAKDMVREDARKLLEAYRILHDHDRLLPNAGETATQSRRGA